MILCHNLGIDAYYGANIASLIGYTLSILVGLKLINHNKDISYKEAIDELIFKNIIEQDKVNKHKYYINKQVIIKTHK